MGNDHCEVIWEEEATRTGPTENVPPAEPGHPPRGDLRASEVAAPALEGAAPKPRSRPSGGLLALSKRAPRFLRDRLDVGWSGRGSLRCPWRRAISPFGGRRFSGWVRRGPLPWRGRSLAETGTSGAVPAIPRWRRYRSTVFPPVSALGSDTGCGSSRSRLPAECARLGQGGSRGSDPSRDSSSSQNAIRHGHGHLSRVPRTRHAGWLDPGGADEV